VIPLGMVVEEWGEAGGIPTRGEREGKDGRASPYQIKSRKSIDGGTRAVWR